MWDPRWALGTYKGQSGYLFSNYYTDNGKDYFFSNVKDIFSKDDLNYELDWP